jgi:phage-related protein
MYTYKCILGSLLPLKKVIWLGNSKAVISECPDPIKEELGFRLFCLQLGKMPLRSRPMKSIATGVYELKEQDHQGWYRVIYALQFKSKLYILHCFKKQSAKTAKADLELARQRLGQIKRD